MILNRHIFLLKLFIKDSNLQRINNLELILLHHKFGGTQIFKSGTEFDIVSEILSQFWDCTFELAGGPVDWEFVFCYVRVGDVDGDLVVGQQHLEHLVYNFAADLVFERRVRVLDVQVADAQEIWILNLLIGVQADYITVEITDHTTVFYSSSVGICYVVVYEN